MSYLDRFRLVDDLVNHLDTVVVPNMDSFIRTRYVGFICVSSVTVIELATRDILVNFATRKHRVFGAFCHDFYEKMNGHVTLQQLRERHLKKFGDRYLAKFDRLLNDAELKELRTNGRSVKASYGNLITWRHSFAHQGFLPPNASYSEAKQGFELGKVVLHCIDAALRR